MTYTAEPDSGTAERAPQASPGSRSGAGILERRPGHQSPRANRRALLWWILTATCAGSAIAVTLRLALPQYYVYLLLLLVGVCIPVSAGQFVGWGKLYETLQGRWVFAATGSYAMVFVLTATLGIWGAALSITAAVASAVGAYILARM